MRGEVLRAGAAAVLVAMLLAVAGCADRTAEANVLIGRANREMTAYAEAGRQLEALLAEAEKLPMTSAEASKGVDLTRRMTARLDEQGTAARAAWEQLKGVEALKVSDRLKTYVRMEIAATRSMLKQDAVARPVVEDLRRLYDLVGTGKATPALVKEVSADIDRRAEELTTLEAETERLEREANAYYDANLRGR